MRALEKDFFRGIKKNKGKFISVFFIILIGAAFFSGLRSSRGDMLLSAEAYYDGSNLMDCSVVGTAGLTEEDVRALEELEEVAQAEGTYTLDVLCEADGKRVVKLISSSNEMNVPTILEGSFPQQENECLLDALLLEMDSYEIGDTIRFESGDGSDLSSALKTDTFTIVGFCNLPQYMDLNRGSGSVGNGKIEGFALVRPEAFSLPVYTEVDVTLTGAKELNSFEGDYEQLRDRGTQAMEQLAESACERRREELLAEFAGLPIPPEQLEALVPMPQWYVLDRDVIFSYANFQSDAERIASLGQLFPIVFFLVAALVSLTAMTRLVEEERQQIGTLKALGSGTWGVLSRYLCYALLPTLTGSVIGVLLGEKLFPLAIMKTYSMLYNGLTSYVLPYNLWEGGIAILASVLCTGLATVFASYQISHAKPAQIMRPAAPKPGKRVLLERIPFLWKRLSFTQKSTVRNMFRYKKRFLMTVIGVAGSMGLILVGLGLHDSIMVVVDKQYEEITHYQATVNLSEGCTVSDREDFLSLLHAEYPEISTFVQYQKSVDVQGASSIQTVTLTIPEQTANLDSYYTFQDRRTKASIDLTEEGVLLSEKTAKSLGVEQGDAVSFRVGGETVSVEVLSVFENYIGHYMFMTPSLYADVCGEELVYNQVLVQYDGVSDGFEDGLGKRLLEQDVVQGVSFTSVLIDWADDTLSSLNTIVLIVLGAAALLAFVVLYNLNSINIAERKRELATLKVLGAFDTEVAAYVYKENTLLTIIGVVFGIGLGVILHQYVIQSIEVDLIMFGRTISWLSYCLGALLTLAFSAIINLVMYPSLKKIDMIESLKSIE